VRRGAAATGRADVCPLRAPDCVARLALQRMPGSPARFCEGARGGRLRRPGAADRRRLEGARPPPPRSVGGGDRRRGRPATARGRSHLRACGSRPSTEAWTPRGRGADAGARCPVGASCGAPPPSDRSGPTTARARPARSTPERPGRVCRDGRLPALRRPHRRRLYDRRNRERGRLGPPTGRCAARRGRDVRTGDPGSLSELTVAPRRHVARRRGATGGRQRVETYRLTTDGTPRGSIGGTDRLIERNLGR
jgi:hypothetical protein